MSDPPRKPLRKGMLIWEPRKSEHKFPGNVWCVASVRKASTLLIYAADTLQAEATLKGTTMPKGWREIDNAALWKRLEEDQA